VGDIITKLDGKSVETVDDFYRLLENHRIGDQKALKRWKVFLPSPMKSCDRNDGQCDQKENHDERPGYYDQ
jgi:hypothetical protein